MKRIRNLMQQDVTLVLRDSIIIYIALGPILMSIALRLFMPSVEDVRLTFAVENSIGASYISEIERYGNVEKYGDRQEIIKRVERTDMVPGVINDNGEIAVLFEGNEAESLIQNYKTIFSAIFYRSKPLDFTVKSLPNNNSFMIEILTVLIIMTTLFLSGVASGFNIVGEKDAKAIRSLAVSPLRMFEFISARGLLAFITSIVTVITGSLIITGRNINYLMLLILLISSCTVTASVSLIIGRLANNQISAISAIKFTMPIFLTVPLLSLFVPQKLQFFMYLLPNYWQFRALRSIYSGAAINFDFLVSSLMTFVMGTALLILLSRAFKKHFGIR